MLNCQFPWFLYFCCAYSSSTILVIMSVEKCIALYFPIKAKSICTVNKAKWVSFVTLFIFVIYNCQVFFNVTTSRDEWGEPFCDSKTNKIYQTISLIAHTVFYAYLPATLMIIFNLAIVVKLCRTKSEMGATGKTASKIAKQGTIMLLAVTCVFILLVAPTNIYWHSSGSIENAFLKNPLSFVITTLLQASNHSINSLIYMLSGSKYRENVRKVLKCGKNRVESWTGSDSGTTYRTNEVNGNDNPGTTGN